MSDQKNQFSRRKFLKTTALTAAAAASGTLPAPSILRAQGAAVKLGILHPVSGALSYSGTQGRLGATLAIEEINAAGGIKGLGGAKIEAVLGDAQSTPDGGNAEVEKMNSAGVVAVSTVLFDSATSSARRITSCITRLRPTMP
jgi:branched-chain amino acid transport system substrate-binding protein